jgi:hypothetical protein
VFLSGAAAALLGIGPGGPALASEAGSWWQRAEGGGGRGHGARGAHGARGGSGFPVTGKQPVRRPASSSPGQEQPETFRGAVLPLPEGGCRQPGAPGQGRARPTIHQGEKGHLPLFRREAVQGPAHPLAGLASDEMGKGIGGWLRDRFGLEAQPGAGTPHLPEYVPEDAEAVRPIPVRRTPSSPDRLPRPEERLLTGVFCPIPILQCPKRFAKQFLPENPQLTRSGKCPLRIE